MKVGRKKDLQSYQENVKQNNKTELKNEKSLQQLILFALKDYNKSDAYEEEFDNSSPFWYIKKIC